MTVNHLIIIIVIIGYVSSIFFLKYITFIISRTRVPLFMCAMSFVTYSILSSFFSTFLVSYYHCIDGSMSLLCRMINWKSALNITGYIWQLPIFFVVYSICLYISKNYTKISFLRVFFIILSTILFSNLFGLAIIALHSIN